MPIIGTAIAFVGGFLADTVVGLAQDNLKSAAQKRLDTLRSVLGQREVPINNDILKAVRQSHLLAGLEVVRWVKLQWNFEEGVSEGPYWEVEASCRLITNYLEAQLRLFKKKDYVPKGFLVSDVVYLNFTTPKNQIQQSTSEAIRTDVLDELLNELQAHLQSLRHPHDLPEDFRKAVIEGWVDNNREWTLFGVMCDYFHEFVKTDLRLQSIIQTEWLADIRSNLDLLTMLLKEQGNNFLDTYSKAPAYFDEFREEMLNEIRALRADHPIADNRLVAWNQLTRADFQNVDIDYTKKFYEGHAPVWSLIKKFTFTRDLQKEIVNHLENQNACVILSAGGEGKSTLLHQLGVFYFERGADVFYNFRPSGAVDTTVAGKPLRRETVLIIDHAEQVENLSVLLGKAVFNKQLKVILAARKNEWYYYLKQEVNRPYRLDIIKFTGNQEFVLGKLSSVEINSLSNILANSKLNFGMTKEDLVNQLNDKRNEFLLSKMLSITKGKNLEAILDDVVKKIYGWDKEHGIDALKALAVIIIIELRSARKGDMIFCSEPFLKLCLREMPVGNLDKVYPLIKGYLLEEAPIQSSSAKIVTRNPIISEIFYKILFDTEDSLLDEADILDSILRVTIVLGGSFGADRSFGQYLMINIPHNYLDRKPELAKQLYRFVFQNNFIPSNCGEWIKAEIQAGNIGDYEDKYSARQICKVASEKSPNQQVFGIWVVLEREAGNIGNYNIENSARWICRLAAERSPSYQVFSTWITLECEAGNIGNYETENSARWICKLASKDFLGPDVFAAWLQLEREGGSIGDYEVENSPRWICKLASAKSPVQDVFAAWIWLELNAGNIGNYETENSARWICKKGAEKSPGEVVYAAWIAVELKAGNIGSYEIKNSARWMCQTYSEKYKSVMIVALWITLEFEAGNIGNYDTQNSARWICQTYGVKYRSAMIASRWIKIEIQEKNYGDYETVNSARWLCKEAFGRNLASTDLSLKTVSIWIILEYLAGNIGDRDIRYTGQWLLNTFYEILKNSADLGHLASRYPSFDDLDEHVQEYVTKTDIIEDYTKWF